MKNSREHQLFMHLRCDRLPLAHRMLTQKGLTDRMEVQPGYWSVIRMAASRPNVEDKAGGRPVSPAKVSAPFG